MRDVPCLHFGYTFKSSFGCLSTVVTFLLMKFVHVAVPVGGSLPWWNDVFLMFLVGWLLRALCQRAGWLPVVWGEKGLTLLPHQSVDLRRNQEFQQYAEVFNVRYKSIHFKGGGGFGCLNILWFEHQECWENETTDSSCVSALSKVCIFPPFDVPSGSFIYATI